LNTHSTDTTSPWHNDWKSASVVNYSTPHNPAIRIQPVMVSNKPFPATSDAGKEQQCCKSSAVAHRPRVCSGFTHGCSWL